MPFNPDGSRKTMAYKKANTGTPTTFKMRSGNGALPFKQMGSSPARQYEPWSVADFGGKNIEKKVHVFGQETETKDTTPKKSSEKTSYTEAYKDRDMSTYGDMSQEEYTKEAKRQKAGFEKTGKWDVGGKSSSAEGDDPWQSHYPEVSYKPEDEPTGKPEKTWREKKGEFKGQKKDFRKTRKDFRKGNKEEIKELKASGASREEIKAARKENRQEQKDLRQAHKDDLKVSKEAWKSDPEYQEHKAERKQEFKDAANRLAMQVHPDFDPGQVAEFDEMVRSRESKKISDEYKVAETERLRQANLSGAEAYAAEKEKQNQLAQEELNAVGEEGANLESTEETT